MRVAVICQAFVYSVFAVAGIGGVTLLLMSGRWMSAIGLGVFAVVLMPQWKVTAK